MIKYSALPLVCFLLVTTSAMSQISSGKTERKVDKPVREKKVQPEIDERTASHVYVGFAPGSNFRTVTPNKFPFGEELGVRAEEKPLKNWSYSLGIRNYMHKYLQYDVSVAFFKYGEQYTYNDPYSDSSFAYNRTYRYMAIPLMIYGSYGKRLQIKAGAGLVPQFFLNSRYTENVTARNGKVTSSELDQKEGFQVFNLGAQFSVGLQAQLNPQLSVYFLPAYLTNFLSTLNEQGDYIHKSNRMNYNFGIVYSIPAAK